MSNLEKAALSILFILALVTTVMVGVALKKSADRKSMDIGVEEKCLSMGYPGHRLTFDMDRAYCIRRKNNQDQVVEIENFKKKIK